MTAWSEISGVNRCVLLPVRGDGTGTAHGPCLRKDEESCRLMDVLPYSAGIAVREQGSRPDGQREARRFIADALFHRLRTSTSIPPGFEMCWKAVALRDTLPPPPPGSTRGRNLDTVGRCRDGFCASVSPFDPDEDVRSLRETLIYGLKGMGAYYHHAVYRKIRRRDRGVHGEGPRLNRQGSVVR